MTGYQASARTSVLTNSDLLYQILTFVAALRIWESRSIWLESSPLVQCVTVCRTFNELAIQLLWRTLPSLFPLWHLLAPRNTSHHTYLGEERPDYLRKVCIWAFKNFVSLTNSAAGYLCQTVRRPSSMGALPMACHSRPPHHTRHLLGRLPRENCASSPPYTGRPLKKWRENCSPSIAVDTLGRKHTHRQSPRLVLHLNTPLCDILS